MDKFELYELLALILPGAVLLFGLSKLFPELMLFSFDKDFSAGAFGVFALLAYAMGHVVQVLGGGIEVIWRRLRGTPSEWMDNEKKQLIFGNQKAELETKIAKRLGIAHENFTLTNLTRKEWLNIIKQMRITVEIAGRTGRLDKFQAVYMMCRGLIASLIILAFVSTLSVTLTYWYIPYVLLSFAIILFYRMSRFERASVRELFIQFLQLPEIKKEK
jgi:hypothetical protein